MNDSDGNEQRRQIIKGKWEQESSERANLKEATIRDLVFRDLNTEVVREYLSPEDVVLDIGCGNGFATAEYARVTQHMLGVDYMRGLLRRQITSIKASSRWESLNSAWVTRCSSIWAGPSAR